MKLQLKKRALNHRKGIPKEITRLEQSIFRYMKKKALSLEGSRSQELISYQLNFEKHTQRPFKSSNLTELLTAISDAQIVYLGDFHTFNQSSKNFERILRSMTDNNSKWSIGVEFVHHQFQDQIDYFLSKQITEREFLESINYQDSWRFPWNHYRPLFELAKNNNIKILALNSDGSLKQRDQKACEIISLHTQNNPTRKMLVLFGEYHLVSNKLPKLITKATSPVKQLIIYQNLDSVYWRSRKKNQPPEIVKFNQQEFVLLNAPPWIKYESMIYWYDNLSEDPDFDIHEYIIESGHKNLTENSTEIFFLLLQKVITILKISLPPEKLSDFNLYDCSKLDYLCRSFKKIKAPSLINFYRNMISEGRTFKMPFTNYYYCPNYSINRLSFLAGCHLWQIAKENDQPEKVLLSNKQLAKFYFFFYQSMISYFCSKILNPYRKCDLYLDLRDKIEKTNNQQRKKMLQAAIHLIDQTRSPQALLKNKSLKTVHQLARMTGNFHADILYDSIFRPGSPDFTEIWNQIINAKFTNDDFLKIRKRLLPNLKYRKTKKRLF